MKLQLGRLVLVEWDDASSNDRWRDADSLSETETMNCLTVGYLIRANSHELVLAQSLTGDNDVSATWAIPRGCVQGVKYLGRGRVQA